MKSPLREVGAASTEEEERRKESETEPSVKHQTRSEKDSGYSDSSSDSTSSEETPHPTKNSTPDDTQKVEQAPVTYTPVYILQNVVLEQPRIVLLQGPLCRHHKRSSPDSYLPILRSYPKIAPRLAPTPPSTPNSTAGSPAPTTLLEVSLRSLALLRRTRETQRSIRELRAHAILYQRALRGEEGGWERLQRAMERSGSYRNRRPLPGTDGIPQAEESLASSVTPLDDPVTSEIGNMVLEENGITSSEDGDTETEEVISSGNSVMSPEAVSSEGEEGNI
ncbi:uncharacterized protein LOC134949688 [Pseudophryne corroboree]|uniref:uncharacterized protein LOC134949687 n=1 Tax=Pseudophryne corroboree TaxID=495146 RepID=UPI0030821631